MSLLIGKKAPEFTASAIVNGNKIIQNLNLNNYKNYYIVLFFYPKDFTFVCPTELYEFQKKIDEFSKRKVQVLAVSTDSVEAHMAWLNIPIYKGGIQGVSYPIISDINKTISYNYGVLSGNTKIDDNNNLYVESDQELIAYRGLFLIDKNLIIRHQLINDFPLGRNVNEVIRIVDALQHFEKHGEVCPANWQKGKKAITPTSEGVINYMSNIS
jgi:peroxiredoxin (alkyl hydroperoxide reductase subunit C)